MKTLGALLTVSILQIIVTSLCIPPTSTSSITTIDPCADLRMAAPNIAGSRTPPRSFDPPSQGRLTCSCIGSANHARSINNRETSSLAIQPSTKSYLSPRQPILLTTPSRQNPPLSYELETRDKIYRQCPGKEPTDAEEARENDENDSIPKRLMRRCEMGRKKGYYELNPERATDHLYDIKVDSAVGKEVADKQFGPLMARIHKTVDPK